MRQFLRLVLKRKTHPLLGIILTLGCFYNAVSQSLQEQARVQYYQFQIEEEGVSVQEKTALYDSLIHYYLQQNDTESYKKYLLDKMRFYYENGETLEAYKTGIDFLKEFEKPEKLSPEQLMQRNAAHLIIAKSCHNLEMFDESISHLFSVIQHPDNRYTIEAYSYLGFIFMRMKQMEQSKQYNAKALQLLSEADSMLYKRSSSIVYNNLAGYFYNQKQLDSALYYLNLSMNYFEFAEHSFSSSYIYHNMAIIYQEMGEFAMAENYLHKAIEMSKDEPYNRGNYLQNLAFILFEKKQYAEAEKYYLKALQVAETTTSNKLKSSIMMELADLYYEKQQYQKAWDYLKKGVTLKDSAFNSQDMEKIALLSQQFDNYKITAEKELLEKELLLSKLSNQKKNIIVGILITLLIILTAIAIFVVRKIMKNSEANVEKNTEETKEEVRKEYENTLEERNRKLASNALFLMKINEMLAHLEKNIRQQLSTDDPEKLKEITQEMMHTIAPYNAGQSWEEFKLYFEEVHSSFYKRINQINPNLSKMEQRLCALLALNMNTKEIAQMTNRSVRTIETLIYRLRKDLNIPPLEKTTHFLQNLLYD